MSDTESTVPARGGGGVPRRRLLGYVGSAVAGAALAAPATAIVLRDPHTGPEGAAGRPTRISPFGKHQPGIAASTAPFVELVALDLHPETDRAGLARLLRLWTGDIVALADGRPAPGDTAPELAAGTAGLTITVGLGALPLLAPPPGLVEVPAMRHDRLQERWGGGDLLAVVAGHDGTTVAHAVRRLVADAAPFARLRWRQAGFWNGVDEQGRPVTGRNLFGQVDGSANPAPGTDLFDETVWIPDGPWAGGTTLAVRRIRMDLDTWDRLTRAEQERSVGRRLETGAPLSGGAEQDDLDLAAIDDQGRRLIAGDAHARRAHHSLNAGRRIFRKGVNYTHPTARGVESGLVFLSYQADLGGQFVPIQQALDDVDALNQWTTAIGSASFAILPGFREGGWIGEALLS